MKVLFQDSRELNALRKARSESQGKVDARRTEISRLEDRYQAADELTKELTEQSHFALSKAKKSYFIGVGGLIIGLGLGLTGTSTKAAVACSMIGLAGLGVFARNLHLARGESSRQKLYAAAAEAGGLRTQIIFANSDLRQLELEHQKIQAEVTRMESVEAHHEERATLGAACEIGFKEEELEVGDFSLGIG